MLASLVVGINLALARQMPTGSVCEAADIAVKPLAALGVLLGVLAVWVCFARLRTSPWIWPDRYRPGRSRLKLAAYVPLILPVLSSVWLVVVVAGLRWEGRGCGT